MCSLKVPRLSIIVPVYKVEAYLSRCVDSILNQTFSDFELLLIDDGSPDDCGHICDEYAEKDMRVRVFHKENGGVSSARNLGLENSCAEYVTFCDSDDYLDPDWLEKLYSAIDTGFADLLCADANIVDKNGRLIRRDECRKGFFCFDSFHQKAEFLLGYFLNGGNTGSVCKNIFRTEIICKNSIRFCETCGNYAEDLCFVLEYVLYCGCVEACNIAGYNYVQHEGSMMDEGTVRPKFNEVNEVSKQFGKRFISMCTDDAEKEIMSVFHYMIMRPEYHKIVREKLWTSFVKELKKIKDRSWCREHTRSALMHYSLFCRLLGNNEAKRAVFYSVMALCCLKLTV